MTTWQELTTCALLGTERSAPSSSNIADGEDALAQIGAQPGNIGFYLPALAKDDFFRTVIRDGALPRKTFSMGEANEKRYYLECRSISD